MVGVILVVGYMFDESSEIVSSHKGRRAWGDFGAGVASVAETKSLQALHIGSGCLP